MRSLVLSLLFVFSVILSFSQSLDWYEVSTPDNFINSTYFHAPMAKADGALWVASVVDNQEVVAIREYGKLQLRKMSLDGSLIETDIIAGKGHVSKMRTVGDDLYMHLIVFDSLQLNNTWIIPEDNFSEDLFVKRDVDGLYSYHRLGNFSIVGVGITADGHFVFSDQNGFGGSVELKVIDMSGEEQLTKFLPNIGYISNIEEKAGGEGFVVFGSCLNATMIDGIEIEPPSFYSNYILSLDANLNLEWYKIIDDISCVKSFGWSDGNVAYWYGGTAIAPIFDEEPFDGPNQMGLEFFLTGIENNAFSWVNETPGSEGWYGATPSEQQALGVDSEGNIYVIGQAGGNSIPWENGEITEIVGSRDVFMASYSPDGDLRWARTFGSPNFDLGLSICVNDIDDFFITASLSGIVELEGETIDGEFGALLLARFNTGTLTGTKFDEGLKLSIHPNPTSDRFSIQSTESPIEVGVISTRGEVLRTWRNNIPKVFDISSLHNGLYAIYIRNSNGVTIQKLIKN